MGRDAEQPRASNDPVVAIYPIALPRVYGYLLPRCGSTSVAEDLVSETFLAAVSASRQGSLAEVSVAWLIGVARHKLIDHWRKLEREQRGFAAVDQPSPQVDDPWDEWLDTEAAHAALARLPVPQRAALTLRYLDGLPVAVVAEHLERSLHARRPSWRARAPRCAACTEKETPMPADPLDALRLPVVPVEPRPEFAQALLARLQAVDVPSERRATPTIRYFVTDLDAAVEFYRELLGFEEELRPSPVFAMLYRGDLRLLLSVPGTHPGGHALPDGTVPTPGGWNRILIQVADLDATIEALRRAGVHFLDDMPRGIAVRQVLLEDPSGNPIELFEPASGYHERPHS